MWKVAHCFSTFITMNTCTFAFILLSPRALFCSQGLGLFHWCQLSCKISGEMFNPAVSSDYSCWVYWSWHLLRSILGFWGWNQWPEVTLSCTLLPCSKNSKIVKMLAGFSRCEILTNSCRHQSEGSLSIWTVGSLSSETLGFVVSPGNLSTDKNSAFAWRSSSTDTTSAWKCNQHHLMELFFKGWWLKWRLFFKAW